MLVCNAHIKCYQDHTNGEAIDMLRLTVSGKIHLGNRHSLVDVKE